MPKKRPGRSLWFKLNLNSKPIIDAIPEQNVGLALKAGMAYFLDGEIAELDPLSLALFNVLKASIDEANASYEKAVTDGRRGAESKYREGYPPLPTLTHGKGVLTDKELKNHLTANGIKADSPGGCNHDTSWMEG